ncbi:MAG: TetR/AcrR family transcriptional regulator [Planctomycetota bacterium]
MSGTKEPKSYHHGDLRAALVVGAVDLIREEGAEGLSLRKVAKRVGVSHAAPYRHFEDLAALVCAVADDGFRLLGDAMTEALDDDPARSLAAIGRAYVRFAVGHPGHFQVMFRAHERKPPDLIESSSASFGVLVEVIRRGQEAGQFAEGDPDILSLSAWSLVHGLASLLVSRVPVDKEGPAGQSREIGVDEADTMARGVTETLLTGVLRRS